MKRSAPTKAVMPDATSPSDTEGNTRTLRKRNAPKSSDIKSSESEPITMNKSPKLNSKLVKTVAKKKNLQKTAATAVSANAGEELSPYFHRPPPLLHLNALFTSDAKLPRDFYNCDAETLCKLLLGTVLVRRVPETGEILRGVIVETEAYPGQEDKASHSYQGRRTKGNQAMFMDPGTAYVYFTYGMYFCMNISSNGEGSACLLRAVEPLEDYEIMHTYRSSSRKKKAIKNEEEDREKLKNNDKDSKKKGPSTSTTTATTSLTSNGKRWKPYELANGPGKLCLAFNIQKESCDKTDMAFSNELWIEFNQKQYYRERQFEIEVSKRIGIDSTPPEARDKLMRYFIKDNLAVSGAKIGQIKKRLIAKN